MQGACRHETGLPLRHLWPRACWQSRTQESSQASKFVFSAIFTEQMWFLLRLHHNTAMCFSSA